jgi:hypothetical protein
MKKGRKSGERKKKHTTHTEKGTLTYLTKAHNTLPTKFFFAVALYLWERQFSGNMGLPLP